MTTIDEFAKANLAATERLEALVASLSADDLATPMGEHWTVASALAHLAYWDRRHAEVLRHNLEGHYAPEGEPDWMDDVQNDALLAEWLLIPHEAAKRLVLESASQSDGLIATVPDEFVARLIERDEAHLLRRSRHRHEHLYEIEQALGR